MHEMMLGLDWNDLTTPDQAYWYLLEEFTGPDKLRRTNLTRRDAQWRESPLLWLSFIIWRLNPKLVT